MDITAASHELMHGLIGNSGAELIVEKTGEIYIDASVAKHGIIELDAESIRELMLDLAVALRLAESA